MCSKKLVLGATVLSVAVVGAGCSSADKSADTAASSETSVAQTATSSSEIGRAHV